MGHATLEIARAYAEWSDERLKQAVGSWAPGCSGCRSASKQSGCDLVKQ